MDFGKLTPKDSLIVTASRRQARFLREQYQEQQIEQGKTAWESLNIMPWASFIEKCWSLIQQTTNKKLPSRLSKEQSQYLWQKIVLNSKYTDTLLNAQQTVKQSFDAWRMMCQWQINDFSFVHGDADQEAFAEWYFEYKKQLEKNHWLDSYQVANLVAEKIEKNQKAIGLLPEKLAFYGFKQITPQQSAIIDIVSRNRECIRLTPEKRNVSKKIYSTETQEQEFISAIRWAVRKLQQKSEKSIAILVPDLEQQSAKLQRIIQKELYPQEFVKGEQANYWHDISISDSLDKQPMIEVVLTWLKFFGSSLAKNELRSLLLTPYLYSSEEDYWQATQLELDIRKSNKGFYSIQALEDLLFKREIKLSWFETLKTNVDLSSENSSFVSFIKKLLISLEELHFNGIQALSSHEFQLQKQFLEKTKESARLSKVAAAALSWSSALKVLKNYLSEQSFHQETPSAPIKVMGMLEALEIEYDAIWFVSATDKILPLKASLNPFLSKALQLKHSLPGSSHSRELEYAQTVLDSLLVREEINFSYATHEGEQEQLLSPLLKLLSEQVGVQSVELDSELPDFVNQWPVSQLEAYQDEQGLELISDGYAAGGTGLLKAQAASPFDAYLRYRLGLYPFEQDDLGISFMERGNLFHKIMQVLWQHLKTQKALLAYSDDELIKLVDRTITTILNIESKHLYLLNQRGFFESEKARLQKLVMEALEFDKARVAFEVIATEAKRQIEVGGLKLNITIDRIDQLEDGSLIIIDYKTGVPRLIDLMNEPIGEPQLLLYAISEHKETSPVAGILFYQAHLKVSKYTGFTEDSEMIAGVKALKDLANNPYADDFETAIEQWRKMLNEIAKSFKRGDAQLTDYSGNYGDHYPVSRWLERNFEFDDALKNLSTSKGAN